MKPLCEHCQAVDLDPEVLCNTSNKQWCLGAGTRISASSCPLCDLIRRVYHENQRLRIIPRRLDLEERVFLRWVNSDGIESGGRPGFEVGGDASPSHMPDWIDGIWICLQVTRAASDAVRNICCLLPEAPAEFDVHRMKEWICCCEADHAETCSPEIDAQQAVGRKFTELKVFRLLDVKTMCVAQFMEDDEVPPYVALSYVWGSTNSVRLTMANLPDLTTTCGFSAAQPLLPRTINDAITLVQRPGLRFLWVDTLCLLQNDAEDVRLGVNVMDCIYEAAHLTVVAAEGYNAHSGLPGIRSESRMSRRNFEIKPELFLGLAVRLDWLVERSVYRTRGWTFQEQFLSKRALYFIDGQLFFRCRAVDWPESFVRPLRSGAGPTSVCGKLARALRLEDSIKDFTRVLRSYSHSQFSNEDDALRAFSGILRRVSDQLGNLGSLNGLPFAILDASLVFKPLHNTVIRRRFMFPSYSWAGWRGAVGFGFGGLPDSQWLQSSTWIIFNVREPKAAPSPAPRPYRIKSASDNGPPDFQAFQFFPPLKKHLRDGDLRTGPTVHSGSGLPDLPYALLQFWTFSTIFRIHVVDRLLGRAIIICDDRTVGEISLDGYGGMAFFDMEEEFEFIFLSITPDSSPSEPKFHVMMVERIGSIAERRGIGCVRMSGRAPDSQLCWKEIFLA